MSATEDDRYEPQDEGEDPRPSDSDVSWTLAEWDRMWRPSMWLKKSPGEHGIHAWHIVAIVALISYANVIANRVLDPWLHIPFNLGILGVAVAIARNAGAGATDLGYRKDRIKRGLVVGGIVMGVIAVGILIGVAMPFTRDFFRDDRVIEQSTEAVLFDALIRIPIATAFYEETLFRGVLFGMFARRWAPLWAGLATSLLFGLWHILPTLDTLLTNPAGENIDSVQEIALALTGTVVGLTLAGFVFLWLRLRSNSTVAPVMAHIATNSFALLAALFVVRVLG